MAEWIGCDVLTSSLVLAGVGLVTLGQGVPVAVVKQGVVAISPWEFLNSHNNDTIHQSGVSYGTLSIIYSYHQNNHQLYCLK
jgi:hypothetical protein